MILVLKMLQLEKNKTKRSPDWCVSVGWALGIVLQGKGRRFNSRSGHKPELQIGLPVRAHTEANQVMFLFHINVSLPRSPSLHLSKK